jgi:hypothetical protein
MALNLKIHINGDSKMMRFTQEMTVAEVIRDIQTKSKVGGDDYGLFDPGDKDKSKPPMWFKDNQPLMAYGITNGVRDSKVKDKFFDIAQDPSHCVELQG